MIGLLHVPSAVIANRRPLAKLRLPFLLAFLAVTLPSSQLWGQDLEQFFQQLQNQQGGGQAPVKDEEPEEKPTLAERNNITPNPLMTLEEEKTKSNQTRMSEYASALRSPNPRTAEEQIIRDGVKFRVQRMTLPENWKDMARLRRDLATDIDSDRFAGDSHPRTRRMALDAAVKYLAELLSDQPDIVKLNAALLLGQLNEKSIDRQKREPARPYTLAAEPLVEVIRSSDQDTVVKIAALQGLRRILKDATGGSLSSAMRDQVAEVLVGELQANAGPKLPQGQAWYLWRIVDSLGMVGSARNSIQQPVVADALWETMLNESLPWHLRTQAARSLSQLNFDSSINVGLISHEIVNLCGRMTATYNRQPGNPYWRQCFMDLYLAFNANTQEESDKGWGLSKQVKGASLRPHEKLVDGAYAQVLNMVNGVMANDPGQAVPTKTLKEAADWLKSNPPTDQKLHAGAKTVDAIQKAGKLSGSGDESTAVSQQTTPGNGD